MNVKSVEKKPVRIGIFKQKKVSTLGQYSGYSTADYRGFDYHSEYLEMRDGIKLAADICLPKKLEKIKKFRLFYFLPDMSEVLKQNFRLVYYQKHYLVKSPKKK
jgi:hypothetical protein